MKVAPGFALLISGVLLVAGCGNSDGSGATGTPVTQPTATPAPAAPTRTAISFSGAVTGSMEVVATRCNVQANDFGTGPYMEVSGTVNGLAYHVVIDANNSADRRVLVGDEAGGGPGPNGWTGDLSGVTNFDPAHHAELNLTLQPDPSTSAKVPLRVAGSIAC